MASESNVFLSTVEYRRQGRGAFLSAVLTDEKRGDARLRGIQMQSITLWTDLEDAQGLLDAGWTQQQWDRMQRVAYQQHRPTGCVLSSVPNLSFEMELAAVKSLIRPGLRVADWGTKQYQHKLVHLDRESVKDSMPRIDGQQVSCGEFERQFVVPGVPVVITGLAEGWGCSQGWSSPSNWEEVFNGVRFRVGSDDQSQPVMMKADSFMRYTRELAPQDDNPLYLFQHLGDQMAVNDPAKAGQQRVVFAQELARHNLLAQDYSVRVPNGPLTLSPGARLLCSRYLRMCRRLSTAISVAAARHG